MKELIKEKLTKNTFVILIGVCLAETQVKWKPQMIGCKMRRRMLHCVVASTETHISKLAIACFQYMDR